MYSQIIRTIAAGQLREEYERAARIRLAREIRLSVRSAAGSAGCSAARPSAGRSLRRYLRPRASAAAA